MSEKPFNIPFVLNETFFFPEEKVVIDPDNLNYVEPYFSCEILYYANKLSKPYPWESETKSIVSLLVIWEEEKKELVKLHKEKSKKVQFKMKNGLALFYMFLFWGNDRPVALKNNGDVVKELKYKAVNLEERMEFIRNNPQLYHSFVQLSELFTEQHKLFAKKQAIQKMEKKTSI